jgi:hypothetical protein
LIVLIFLQSDEVRRGFIVTERSRLRSRAFDIATREQGLNPRAILLLVSNGLTPLNIGKLRRAEGLSLSLTLHKRAADIGGVGSVAKEIDPICHIIGPQNIGC